jgi:hypothetical protein
MGSYEGMGPQTDKTPAAKSLYRSIFYIKTFGNYFLIFLRGLMLAVSLLQIEYTMELKFEGKTFVASANNKKAAKTACAAEAWNEIRPRIS